MKYELSIVIPAYNEEKRIKPTLLSVINYIKENELNAEIIVVDDGSTDRTKNIARVFRPIKTLITYRQNRGKGYAIARGVANSEGEYVLIMDADSSTPISQYQRLEAALKSNVEDFHIATGCRQFLTGDISPIRYFIGRFGNWVIKKLFSLDYNDTQCGFKLFQRGVARDIFRRLKTRRFGFDVEVLLIARESGYKVVEVPVVWHNSLDSKFRFWDVIYTAWELIKLRIKH